MNLLVRSLIERAKKTPYTDLQHSDGSLYMGRYWLKPYPEGGKGFAARIHHIATSDYDRALHDHPWNFLSIVLNGGYIEQRPYNSTPIFRNGVEMVTATERKAGSIAFRRATDRHRISMVMPDTYTLFVTGAKVQPWGFYTPEGKVYYRDFETVHGIGIHQ